MRWLLLFPIISRSRPLGMVQQVRWGCACMYLLTLPLLSFARVGHACHFETFNISKKSLSKTPQQHRHWSGPCSLSLSLAFCPVVIVLSQPAVWCHYNTRSHLKYWFARRRWEEGTKSYEISWKADRAWFVFFLFYFFSAGLRCNHLYDIFTQ